MNTQELEYILCIAKHKNLTKAAQELYISQPTLSKHLKKIEQELNGKIFNYNKNQYTPTYLGRKYIEYAERILAVDANWKKELEDLSSCNKGELSIAFPPLRSACIIPKVMPEFCKKYPNIKINFLEESNEIEEKLLHSDTLDLAVFNETTINPELEYQTVGKEEILIMTPTKLSDQSWLDLESIKDESFILNFPNQTTGKIVNDLFDKADIIPNVLFHTRNIQAAALLCEQGHVICFVPETYVDILPLKKKPNLYSIGKHKAYSTLVIAYKKNKYMTEYEKYFIELIHKYLCDKEKD